MDLDDLVHVPLLRVAIIALSAAASGAMGAVMWRHWRVWRETPARTSLSPLHVALLAGGGLVNELALAWSQVDTIDSGELAQVDSAIRLGMFGVAALAVLVALVLIHRHQSRHRQGRR